MYEDLEFNDDGESEYLPPKNPFEQYVIDLSKDTYLDYSHFDTMGELSRYSSLMPWHLNNVKDIMLKEIPDTNRIVDLCAHIGCDSINFSVLYPNAEIIAIEIDPDVYKLLRDNLLRYMIVLNKTSFDMRAYNYDATKILDEFLITESQVVYIDPPWNKCVEKLYLGDMPIEDAVMKLIDNEIEVVILKAPVKMNTEALHKLPLKITKYDVRTKKKLSYALHFCRI